MGMPIEDQAANNVNGEGKHNPHTDYTDYDRQPSSVRPAQVNLNFNGPALLKAQAEFINAQLVFNKGGEVDYVGFINAQADLILVQNEIMHQIGVFT